MSSGQSSTSIPASVAPTGNLDFGLTEAAIEAAIVNDERKPLEEIDVTLLQPYNQVKNLLWIKRNSVYSVALEEWDRKAKLLSERVDRMEKRSGDLKNETYQLVGFFSVFQGVVLTAVTQLTQSGDEQHNCKRVWSPVILTAMAWAVATVGVWQKLSRIEVLECMREDEDQARREAVGRAEALRRNGSAFKFNKIKVKDISTRLVPKKFWGYGIWHFWLNRFGLVFMSLCVFTGIFIASYFLILCNRGLAPIG